MTGAPRRIYATDLEGPVTRNDNALELAERFIPRGGELFARVGLYDDYLAEVSHRPGYRAGGTLRLMIPFLLANGVTQAHMWELARSSILVVPGADAVIRAIATEAPSYIVSTSYCPYVEAVCSALHFPVDRALCTRVDLTYHDVSRLEAGQIRGMQEQILATPPLTIPPGAKGPEDLSEADRGTVQQLDSIFWERMPKLSAYSLVREVRPVGGAEKAEGLRRACEREGAQMRDMMYVGHSITDVAAFRLVRGAGGVTVSFNGDRRAVAEADLVVIADRADPMLEIARTFLGGGRGALEGRGWPIGGKDWIATWTGGAGGDVEGLVRESERRRKQVRGVSIGALG